MNRLSNAALVVLLAASPLRVAADQPAQPAAPASAATAAPSEGVQRAESIEPLHEIGHVTARSPYCAALIDDAAPAANSAVAFEMLLVRTVGDIQDANTNDSLHRYQSARLLEADLKKLGDLAQAGRIELQQLEALAATDPTGEKAAALIALRDALDGAKARQFELARQISKQIATYEQNPPYSLIDLPMVDIPQKKRNKPYYVKLPADSNAYLIQQSTYISHGLYALGPEDIQIGDDLARAAAESKKALALGGC